jgi:hypothetical protein
MIIWLASYPRSGNTFFRILLNHIYGIQTYSIYNDPLFSELRGFADVVGHQKLEMDYEEMAASDELFFVKTHDLPSDCSPAIYLVRDGRDSIVSYAHYIMSFRDKMSPERSLQKSLRKPVKALLRGLGWDEHAAITKKLIFSAKGSQHGTWGENVQHWLKRDAVTFLVRYEDLIQAPTEYTIEAIDAVDLNNSLAIKDGTIPPFEELHQRWPQFFRQGKSGKWRQEMNQELQELFWNYHGGVMEMLGYEKG